MKGLSRKVTARRAQTLRGLKPSVRSCALLTFSFVVCLLAFAQEREGNFIIRIEPSALLQTNVEVPFDIRVNDDLHHPVNYATVTLQIETPQHTHVKVYRAGVVGSGEYKAKPVFPSAGTWNVYVEVHLNGLMSARTIAFNVPASAS